MSDPESALATYVPDPIDTDNPAAICDRLGAIEDELAFVGNELSRAAYWVKKYDRQIDELASNLYPRTTGTIPERKHALDALVALDPLSAKLNEAEAQYAKYTKDFVTLDSRRSVLQSCLKMHTREQEPRFGEGSHNR